MAFLCNYTLIKIIKGCYIVIFVLCVNAMGWYMPPFAKIQTPWTDQEGKPNFLQVTYRIF